MHNREQVMEAIRKNRLIAVIRGVETGDMLATAKALYDGGFRLMEVTFDQTGGIPAAETGRQINMLRQHFGSDTAIGAGTVFTKEQVLLAKEAGAEYLISPHASQVVIQETRSAELVSIPGALTPTEAAAAFAWGADYIKLFPAGELGLSYVKAVLAPMRQIPMLAVGGINLNNYLEFLGAGLAGLGIGSNLVRRDLIAQGAFDEIAQIARSYTENLPQ